MCSQIGSVLADTTDFLVIVFLFPESSGLITLQPRYVFFSCYVGWEVFLEKPQSVLLVL